VTGEETDDLLPMNPEGVEVDDSQVQHGCLSINVHVGQTPIQLSIFGKLGIKLATLHLVIYEVSLLIIMAVWYLFVLS